MKRWQVRDTEEELVKSLMQDTGLNQFICRLLAGRGIKNREEAENFFNGEEIDSPFILTGMDKAISAIKYAEENDEKITIYGDYDCDGVTSTAILYQYLMSRGCDVDWYIPSREEGYGLNTGAIDIIHKNGTKLIITVDNGISAEKEAEYIYSLGMKLVITDHHQIPEKLPRAEAIVNPHLEESGGYKEYAGCGVALKVAMALEEDNDTIIDQFGELAAIGTVADVVPLTGENRVLVKKGLRNMPFSESLGLMALLHLSGFSGGREINSTNIAFTLCPRINAAGRFGHPRQALELLLCEDDKLCKIKAEELSALNTLRQQEELRVMEQAGELIAYDPYLVKQRVIVLAGEKWSDGVIGIAASRLVEKYGKPCVIISKYGDEAKGSARSVHGFSLFKMLDSLKEYLTRYGGHAGAAGFSLHTKDIENFTKAIYDYAKENYPEMPQDEIIADMEPERSDLTVENIESLKFFQPFGHQNPMPLFLLKGCEILSVRGLKDGKYTAFDILYSGSEYKALDFGSSLKDFTSLYGRGSKVDIIASAEINEYNGSKTLNFKVKDIRPAGLKQDRYFSAKSYYERFCIKEPIEPSLAARAVPEKADMKLAYDLIKRCGNLYTASLPAFSAGMNYFKFMNCIDAFSNAGIIKTDLASGLAEILPFTGKADMEKSENIIELKKIAKM